MGKNSDTYYSNYPELLNIYPIDIKDKTRTIRDYTAYMLARTQRMITLEGLPETMPESAVIRILQTHGYFVTPDPEFYPELNGKLYAFFGGLGGFFTPYYTPSVCTVDNPYTTPVFTGRIDFGNNDPSKRNGVIVRHDPYYMGLMPMITRYATLLAEVDISMLLALVMSRTPIGITAPDDRSKASADDFIRKLYDGNIETIASDDFIAGVKAIPITGSGYNVITQLIEAKQYLRAGLYNDLGLSANYNMKRESINSVEAQLDSDALLPLADEILTTLEADFKEFNARFGTDVRPSLGSAWKLRGEVAEAEAEAAVEEAESPEGDVQEAEQTEPADDGKEGKEESDEKS